MAEPLRKETLRFYSEQPVNGLFVVGESNARNCDIPHLPLLLPDSKSKLTLMVKHSNDGNIGNIKTHCSLDKIFSNGDIVELEQHKQIIRTVLSSAANANTLLVTERCENRCTFCSQPPNDLEDTYLYNRAAISILNYNSDEVIGISGGEPTYNKDAFVRLLRALDEFDSPTPLHILSNGRSFKDRQFIQRVITAANDRFILWGIPLYGHKSSLHDSLVQSEGGFSDTVQGLLHLSEYDQPIELRVIPTRKNITDLTNIVRYIAHNLSFVNVISIMNIEPKGWARKNYHELYVPVKEQSPRLLESCSMAINYGMDIRLFNYPLCLLSEDLRTYAVKSISDWKNYYPEECDRCTLHGQCGGFFTSAYGNFKERVEAIL